MKAAWTPTDLARSSVAPMASRVRVSLKPQSNCALYSGGGVAKLAASWSAVGSEICCQGRSWADTLLTNSSDTRICAKVFMGLMDLTGWVCFCRREASG